MATKLSLAQSGVIDMARSSSAMYGLGFLVFAVFAVTLSAGLVTPLLPSMLNQYSVPLAAQTRHISFLNSGYLFAMFIAAPIFGYLSDHIDRRAILIAAMATSTIALYTLSMSSGLVELYTSRILAGLGAGALLPVMMAYVAERSAQDQRMRRFAWVVTAMMTGSLAGPYLGGVATQPETWQYIGASLPSNLILAPVLAVAIISSLALVGMIFVLRRQAPAHPALYLIPANASQRSSMLLVLFVLSAIVMYAVGAFEVGLSTLMRQNLHLDAAQLGMMFAECAVVMLLAQALFFSALFRNFADRYLLIPAFVATSIAVALFPQADTHSKLILAVAVIAGGAGLIAPLIAYRVSNLADGSQGRSFGLQIASSNFGQALGAASNGLLVGLNPQFPYWFAAAILAAGAVWILFRMQPSSSVSSTKSLEPDADKPRRTEHANLHI